MLWDVQFCAPGPLNATTYAILFVLMGSTLLVGGGLCSVAVVLESSDPKQDFNRTALMP